MANQKSIDAIEALLIACIAYDKSEKPNSGIVMIHQKGVTRDDLKKVADKYGLLLRANLSRNGYEFTKKRGKNDLMCVFTK